MTLPDSVLVYPAHGAGSLCGKNMRAERSSTIGTERLDQLCLPDQEQGRIHSPLTSNLPARPEYFAKDAEINRTGAAALSELPPLGAILLAELEGMLQAGEIALDVRPMDDFASGHVPGSVNIALGGQFASWAGDGARADITSSIDRGNRCANRRGTGQAGEGGNRRTGWLSGGRGGSVEGIREAVGHGRANPCARSRRTFGSGKVQVLDVRREPEWDAGHVEGAAWWPLDNLSFSPPEIDHEVPLAVHCKGGYRSMIAAACCNALASATCSI